MFPLMALHLLFPRPPLCYSRSARFWITAAFFDLSPPRLQRGLGKNWRIKLVARAFLIRRPGGISLVIREICFLFNENATLQRIMSFLLLPSSSSFYSPSASAESGTFRRQTRRVARNEDFYDFRGSSSFHFPFGSIFTRVARFNRDLRARLDREWILVNHDRSRRRLFPRPRFFLWSSIVEPRTESGERESTDNYWMGRAESFPTLDRWQVQLSDALGSRWYRRELAGSTNDTENYRRFLNRCNFESEKIGLISRSLCFDSFEFVFFFSSKDTFFSFWKLWKSKREWNEKFQSQLGRRDRFEDRSLLFRPTTYELVIRFFFIASNIWVKRRKFEKSSTISFRFSSVKMANKNRAASFKMLFQRGDFDLQDYGRFRNFLTFSKIFEFSRFSRTKLFLLPWKEKKNTNVGLSKWRLHALRGQQDLKIIQFSL